MFEKEQVRGLEKDRLQLPSMLRRKLSTTKLLELTKREVVGQVLQGLLEDPINGVNSCSYHRNSRLAGSFVGRGRKPLPSKLGLSLP